MPTPPLLIFGGCEGTGKRTLAGRMVGERSHPLPTILAKSPCLWEVRTKYFAASVETRFVANPGAMQGDVNLSARCEGLVLVFDMCDDESFSHLKIWEDFLTQVEPSVALCIANKADVVGDSGAELDRRRDAWLEWCLDNGLEFIECSALHDQVPDGARETEGTERVIEAIGSHTWSGMQVKAKGASASGGGLEGTLQEMTAAHSVGSLDYKKWDSVKLEDKDEMDGNVKPVKVGTLVAKAAGAVEVDDREIWKWMEEKGPTDDDIHLLEELKTVAIGQGFSRSNFFMDSSALKGSSLPAMGPNAAVHLNQAHVLPRVAQVFKVVSQYLKEFPGLTRFCVRLRLWSDIVSEPKDGASNVLPMVVLWCMLESCAAETMKDFLKRVTLSRDAMSEWAESALVSAFVRASDTESQRSDYVRSIVSSAEELKSRGNEDFKSTRFNEAIEQYQHAIHMLEQFYQEGKHLIKKGKDIILSCHLNIAACALKLPKGYDTAVQHCTYALDLDGKNPKAFFRRGLAFFQTPQELADAVNFNDERNISDSESKAQPPPPREVLLSWAIRDFEQADELCPGDAKVKEFLGKARAEANNGVKQLQSLMPKIEEDDLGREGVLDDKEEETFDQVLSMFKSAKADAQSLSDDARRQRAADVASQAAALLCCDDADSGDDSD